MLLAASGFLSNTSINSRPELLARLAEAGCHHPGLSHLKPAALAALLDLYGQRAISEMPSRSEWMLLHQVGPRALEVLDELGCIRPADGGYLALDTRTRNLLIQAGYPTADEALAAIAAGSLSAAGRRVNGRWICPRGWGPVIAERVLAWADRATKCAA